MNEKLSPWARRVIAETEESRLKDGISYFYFGFLHLPCGGKVVDKEIKNGTVKYCSKHNVTSAINLNPEGKLIAY